MSNYADFLIQGEPGVAHSIGDQVIRGAGFRIVWGDNATGTAERGSLAMTALLGAFVGKKRQFVKVELSVFAGPQAGTTVVRLTRVSTGWLAGAIGASRNRKMFEALVLELATPFGQAGTLLGVTQG